MINMHNAKKGIYLAAGFNESYTKKSQQYLETMNQNSNVSNIIFTLDFDISWQYRQKFDNIIFRKISSTQIKSPNPNCCMQHGAFLEAMEDFGDDLTIVFTDTDIVVQRPFSDEELAMLKEFRDGDVGVNYNKTREYCLLEEVPLLRPNVTEEQLLSRYPRASELTVFNTGVIVATCRTYKKLYESYNRHWESFKDVFSHHAKQQWLLSYLIQTEFQPKILSYTIHCHGCRHPWQLRVDEHLGGHKFCIGSQIVLFKHKIKHESARQIKAQKRVIKRLKIAAAVLALVCVGLAIGILFD